MPNFTFDISLAKIIGAISKVINPTIIIQLDTKVDRNSRYAGLGLDLPSRTFPINPQVLKSELLDLQTEIKNNPRLV